ncbi:preprotein translocase subunit YajC [Candidatus Oleimmundimicrobium sp.]|uniref:preprotein translocase subunit YajC n=1 Tax=Candidatus Oleimmundimicrobium sp. TaxID=3060597 RepID=UPI00271DB4E3|nr:preprotein translocase subunit YajC [Candidatus Oleimmundimicrobium sp.]MDO8886715.1 preprotein translocase subunit YajC [Candidatus Oleimmundimicrobium sp.]
MSQSTMSFAYIIFLIAIFYFLLIRPQQLKAKQHRQLISALKVGDKVVSTGGVYGVIKSITDDTVSLEVADKIVVKFARNSIAQKK